MRKTAKIFSNGRSQAVRLPKNCRFSCNEVFVFRDEKTGDVILSSKPDSWDGFFELLKRENAPSDFMLDRDDREAEERELF